MNNLQPPSQMLVNVQQTSSWTSFHSFADYVAIDHCWELLKEAHIGGEMTIDWYIVGVATCQASYYNPYTSTVAVVLQCACTSVLYITNSSYFTLIHVHNIASLIL